MVRALAPVKFQVRFKARRAGKEGTGTDEASANFRDGSTYLSVDGSNGYEAGAGNTNYLKGAIDYTNFIAGNSNYVQAVTLNNPNFATFKDGGVLDGDNTYNDWRYSYV